MLRVLAAGAAFALLACTGANPQQHQAPSLNRSDAGQLVLRADDLRRLAFEFPGTTTLSDAFGGPALQRIQAQSQSLGLRGAREEERSSSRDIAFWDPIACEAVLQVVGMRRLVTPDQPDPPWSATVRQWWARLRNIGGSWKVVEQQDLPPDRWRPVPPEI